MSERGSFCTEYIYCASCFEVAKDVLVSNEKYLKGVVIPSWENGKELPIVAGKIGGLSPGEELWGFEKDLGPEIAVRLCHPMRVAVLADNEDEEIFLLRPSGSVERLSRREDE